MKQNKITKIMQILTYGLAGTYSVITAIRVQGIEGAILIIACVIATKFMYDVEE